MAEVVSEKFVPLSDLEEVESVIAGQPPDSVQGRVFVPEAVRRQQTVKTLRLKAKNDQDLTQLYYFASKYSEENKCAVAIELPDCPGCGLGSEKSRCVMQ